jgi:hypothetical protein
MYWLSDELLAFQEALFSVGIVVIFAPVFRPRK